MASTNWIGGNDAETYTDPYRAGVQGVIGSLANSNLGAQAAAGAERAIGRRYEQRQEQIESDPSFGRNAAVSGKLHDMALAEVGGETSDAYVKGAQTDLSAKEHAAQLGIQEGQLQFGINQENYEREQSQTFGNSFVGGLLKQAIGFGIGGAEQLGLGAAAKGLGLGGGSESMAGVGKQGGLQFKPPANNSAEQAAGGIHGSNDYGNPWMPGYGPTMTWP